MYQPAEQEFLDRLNDVILSQLTEEQFGVSELAQQVNMSRSNLLRKVKKITNLSVSQYIRQLRLEQAMQLLKTGNLNVSEAGYKTGFSSTSYFIKCFREQYGYPPGEVGKGPTKAAPTEPKNNRKFWSIVALSTAMLLIIGFILAKLIQHNDSPQQVEKSIAVLPFINDSQDSSNVYLINGLMESTLTNLQKISDLRVISRTSSEKYRNSKKSSPEIAEELNVNFLVEGSGQKIGDQISLHIQLIDAKNDRHLWAKQYRNKTNDIFKLQQDVAKSIADEIQVVITPEEADQINKIPTENLNAYDYFLQGVDFMVGSKQVDLGKAVSFFRKAINEDPEFALAYAYTAQAYFHMDVYQTEKQHLEELNEYADRAMLLDPESSSSLLAKGLFYLQNRELNLAVSYLEKALHYNPNSAEIIHLLSDFYANYHPNTAKYIEYALKGIKVNMIATDSVSTSYSYLHLANALIQTGFTELSLKYLKKAEDLYADNEFTAYVRAFAKYDQHQNLDQVQTDLLAIYEKDPTRMDILQDMAKVCYMKEDYPSAYEYYHLFDSIRQQYNLNIYIHENLKMAFVCQQLGKKDEANEFFVSYQQFLQSDQSLYNKLMKASEQMYLGRTEDAIELIQEFAEEEKDYHFWLVLFMGLDPMFKDINDDPEFQKAMKMIQSKFWNNHKLIRENLDQEGLLF